MRPASLEFMSEAALSAASTDLRLSKRRSSALQSRGGRSSAQLFPAHSLAKPQRGPTGRAHDRHLSRRPGAADRAAAVSSRSGGPRSAEDAPELCTRLAAHGLDAAGAEVAAAPRLSFLRLHPALAIRHAGGQLFQEAHFELLRVSPNFDLFGLIDAPETRVDNRGGTHFTPPALARSIVEQVLAAIPDLASRQALTLCDPACGSGAFLHEALRALRRAGFNGRLKLVGLTFPTPPSLWLVLSCGCL